MSGAPCVRAVEAAAERRLQRLDFRYQVVLVPRQLLHQADGLVLGDRADDLDAPVPVGVPVWRLWGLEPSAPIT